MLMPTRSTITAGLLLAAFSLPGCGDDSEVTTSEAASSDTSDAATSDGGSSGTSAGTGSTGGGDMTPCAGASVHEGEGTYYGADGSGNCSFPASPGDLLVGAMNQTDYANSAACGACVQVTGPIGSVTVRIVDRCPECAPGDVDLSQQAFEQIAELSAGRVPISWQYVPCDVGGPISYFFKEGSNEFWSAVQVRNHRFAIASLEYSPDGGESWTPVAREEFNYFIEPAGMGPGPYTLRVTDVEGHQLVDEGIPFAPESEAAGAAQFPGCGS